MREKTKKKIENIAFTSIVIAIALIITLSFGKAVHVGGIDNHTIAENETLTISILIENYTGNVTTTRTPELGNLEKISNSEYKFTWTPTFEDAGEHQIDFKIEDEEETIIQTSIITVTNTNLPINIIEKSEPGTISASSTEITIKTDKPATCKYSLQQKPYESMEFTFSHPGSDKTTHTGATPALAEGTHTIYITCQDEQGNHLTDYETIPITVSLAPTATIQLSPRPPLREGKVEVTLTTTENLIDTPDLNYYFDDDQSRRPITLIGSGKRYEGYLIIRAEDHDQIGAFEWKGIDLTNKEGTKITSGEIFIVDTKAPEQITSASIEIQDERILLDWTYEDEEKDDVVKYKVYRKENSGGTSLVDFFEETEETKYYDTDVEYGKAYYYRISAVDEAGNEGELSNEVYTTFIPPITDPSEETATPTKTEKLSPKLMTKLSEKTKEIEKILLDITEAEKKIGMVEGKDKSDAVTSLNLLAQAKTQKSKVQTAKQELQAISELPLTEADFETRTKNILDAAKSAWTETPTSIIIEDSSTYSELIDDTKTKEAVLKIIETTELQLTDKQKEAETKSNQKLQDLITIDATIIKSKITYPEKEESAMTIKKSITTTEPIENAKIVETIGKGIASKASDIIFAEQPEIIEQDPIVMWRKDRFSGTEIIYSIKTDISLIEAKDTKSTLIQLNEEEYKQNGITGLASAEAPGETSPLLIPVIVGVIIIALLTGYYFLSAEKTHLDEPGLISKGIASLKDKARQRKAALVKPYDDSHKKLKYEQFTSQQKEETLTVRNESYSPEKLAEEIPDKTPQIHEATTIQTHSISHHDEEDLEDVQKLHDELVQTYKERDHKELTMSELNDLKQKTNYLRQSLDELDRKNLEAYTEKAKQALEEALRYIHTHQPGKTANTNIGESKKDMVKALLFKRAPQGSEFVLKTGEKLATLSDLRIKLNDMPEDTFRHHVNEQRNDFSTWTREALGGHKLAKQMRKAKTKEALRTLLEA